MVYGFEVWSLESRGWFCGWDFGVEVWGSRDGLGFAVDRLVVEIWRLACMVRGLRLRWGIGLRVVGAAGLWVQGFAARVSHVSFRVSGSGFRSSGFAFRTAHFAFAIRV